MSRAVFNRMLFVLSLAGAGVTLYLTIHHLQNISLPCMATHGCDEVMHDDSSRGFGIPALQAIPTAAFGLFSYIVLAAISFVRVASESPAAQRGAAAAQWLLGLIGVLVSGYLTYLEAYVIHAWCIWCVGSAIIMTLIFLTATAERVVGGTARREGLAGEAS